MLKNYLKSYGYLISISIFLTIIISIISYYFNTPINIIKTIIPIISLFISSIIIGKNTKEKAYLEGLKFSIIYLLITTIFKFIIKTNFNYKVVILYIIMIFTSIIASTIGINLQKKK